MKMAIATSRKLIATVMKVAVRKHGRRVPGPSPVVCPWDIAKGNIGLAEIGVPIRAAINGMIRSLINESTIFPNAAPMITATARSITCSL